MILLSAFLVGLLFLILCWESESQQSLFQKCDANRDRLLNKKEFVVCFRTDSLYEDEGFEALFDHLDTNADGAISIIEYNKAQETLFKPKSFGSSEPEMVSFTDRNGESREIPLQSVYQAMEDNMKGIKRTSDNKLVKEEEKTAKVADLSTSDPQVDSIVKLGNWSYHRLRELEVVIDGQLKSMQSDDMKFRSNLGDDLYVFPHYSSPQSSIVNMTLRILQNGVIEEYHVTVHYDRISYYAPYLHLIRVVRKFNDNELEISVPEPVIRDWSKLRKTVIGRARDLLWSNPLYVVILVVFWIAVAVASFLIFCRSESDDNGEDRLKSD